MKRFLAITAAIAMLLFVLTACGTDTNRGVNGTNGDGGMTDDSTAPSSGMPAGTDGDMSGNTGTTNGSDTTTGTGAATGAGANTGTGATTGSDASTGTGTTAGTGTTTGSDMTAPENAGDMVDGMANDTANGQSGDAAGNSNGTSKYGTNVYGSQRYAADGYNAGTYAADGYTATNNGGLAGMARDAMDSFRQDEEDDSAADRVRYQLMLDNARVRDTDGFLFDGENAHHDTF